MDYGSRGSAPIPSAAWGRQMVSANLDHGERYIGVARIVIQKTERGCRLRSDPCEPVKVSLLRGASYQQMRQ